MKFPIKKYVMDESLSWEERYKQLEAHHVEETAFLIKIIEDMEEGIDRHNEWLKKVDNLRGSRT